MGNEGRIGIGSTALFTLAGVGVPLLTWWVSGPLMVATGLVAIWGFVPAVQNIFTGNDDAGPGEDIRTLAPSAPSQEPHNSSVPMEVPKWVPNWPLRNLFFSLKPDLQQSKNEADFEALADEIMDKLSTGQLLAWGRAIGSERTLPLFPIPEDYWLRAKLNIWLLDDEPGGGNVLQAGPDSLSAPNKTQYREILINQAQALAEWPNIPAAPITQGQPPTMFEIFKADFAGLAGKFEETDFTFSDGATSKCNTTMLLDFAAGSKFIAFYVPRSDLAKRTYEALAGQATAIATRLDTNIGMSMKRLGEHGMTESSDLVFTGFVHLYCEDSLSVHELSDLTKLFEANGLKLRVKDHNYHTLKLLEWHNSKAK